MNRGLLWLPLLNLSTKTTKSHHVTSSRTPFGHLYGPRIASIRTLQETFGLRKAVTNTGQRNSRTPNPQKAPQEKIRKAPLCNAGPCPDRMSRREATRCREAPHENHPRVTGSGKSPAPQGDGAMSRISSPFWPLSLLQNSGRGPFQK